MIIFKILQRYEFFQLLTLILGVLFQKHGVFLQKYGTLFEVLGKSMKATR